MRPCTLALLVLLAALRAGSVDAQNAIHHCVAANGTPVFTDQPCASVNAATLTERAPPASPRHSAGFAPVSCPATVQDLKRRIATAFATHDANSLAGLMLWRGYGGAAAKSDLRYLRKLVDEPLMGIDGGSTPAPTPQAHAGTGADAGIGPSAGIGTQAAMPVEALTRAPADPLTLTLHLGGIGDDAAYNPRFAVSRVADCLWLANGED